jgi:hypothetical protein
MPYESKAQAGYFHTHKAELEKQGVDVGEWDRATKGKHLPARAQTGGTITSIPHQPHNVNIQYQVGGVPGGKTRAEYGLAVNPHVNTFDYAERNSNNYDPQLRQYMPGPMPGGRMMQNLPTTNAQDMDQLQNIPNANPRPAQLPPDEGGGIPDEGVARGGTMTGVGRAEHAVRLAKRMAAGGFDPMGKPGASAMGDIFEGPIRTKGAGRTDVNKHDVAAGSYVLPADAVSIAGDGNTEAGFGFFKDFFKPLDRKPLDLTGGMSVHGTPMKASGVQKPGLNLKPHPAKVAHPGAAKRAEGGVDGGEGTVPIIDAGGEIVVPPRLLTEKFGALDHGHNVMDEIVGLLRSQEIERLKTAPPPKK